jgi:hypothetical protein
MGFYFNNIRMKNLLQLLIFCCFYNCKNNSEKKSPSNENQISFNLGENVSEFSTVIDSIKTLQIKLSEYLALRNDGYEVISISKDRLYLPTRNEDKLLVIDTNGKVINTIQAGLKDQTSPIMIRSYTHTRDRIIILEPGKERFFFYDRDGNLENVIGDIETNFKKSFIAAKDEENLILVKYHDKKNSSTRREETVVGKIYSIEGKSSISLKVAGGSETRDRIMNNRFFSTSSGILYNYWHSNEIYRLEGRSLKLFLSLQSSDFISDYEMKRIDDADPDVGLEILNTEVRKKGKMDNLRFIYLFDDILFFTTFKNNKLYWVYYNLKKKDFKITKFEPMTVYNYNGTPFWPYIKNAKENYFVVTLDGQEMQPTDGKSSEYDKSKPYLIKIYPKYLKQSGWN